ncbi:homeobox protein HOX1A isoform X2 [Aristolochia californica]|uniref:homeobox protein HOX1A isoform X2 n=1 Tax=Aristolochia californica TaxID=171875 RepID=UPI0035DCA83B
MENGEANNALSPQKIWNQQKCNNELERTEDVGSRNSRLDSAGIVDVESSLGVAGKAKLKAGKVKGHNSGRLRCKGKKALSKIGHRKYSLRSSANSSRVLRSRSQGNNVSIQKGVRPVDVCTEQKKNKRKRKGRRKVVDDEFSKLRKHIRYLVSRINYEQSLLDAYASEGWKGLSLDKIRPEKELQRASSEIVQCKLKIRNLVQHLDDSCAKGRFQESLFDSEGQIDSEDIFCAKCGSKELSADNDIILCDGVCERGFHQMCLEPPLLKEQFPPEDEGWLCPGCDCKVDCIDLLNDVLGCDLSISDSWEKVFPEAASVAAADKSYDDLPSDSSEDYNYDPDGPDLEVKDKNEDETGEDSSSTNSSDFTTASDGSGTTSNHKVHVPTGFSSDDSDDDDYDPDGQDPDKNIQEDGSSSYGSDFSSDTDDLSILEDDGDAVQDDVLVLMSPGPSNLKPEGKRKHSTNSEVQSLLEEDPSGLHSGPVPSRKRLHERLDYKKLHDEEYGDRSSDSSDDEDWTETNTPKRKRNDGIGGSPEDNENNQDRNNNSTSYLMLNHKEATPDTDMGKTENSLKGKTKKNLTYEDSNCWSGELHKGNTEFDSIGSTAKSSGSKVFGESISKRLHLSLKENIYPSRERKENLSKELGITVQQVSKWFENARRNLRRSTEKEASEIDDTASKETSPVKAQIKDMAAEMKLCQSLKENMYPSRETKEQLSEELGITVPQVSKWFEHARRGLRRHSTNEATGTESSGPGEITPYEANRKNDLGEMASETPTCKQDGEKESAKGDNAIDLLESCLPVEGGRNESGCINRGSVTRHALRKRKGKSSDQEAAVANPLKDTETDRNVQLPQENGKNDSAGSTQLRRQTRSRKSVS